jgi:phage terminase large subunit
MAAQVSTPSQSLTLAPKVRDLFFDASGNWIPSDYKVMHGGRGGLKSWGFARMAVILAARKKPRPLRIACAREYQTSIRESVHQTVAGQIVQLGYSRYFHIGQQEIRAYDGSEFFFAGIKTDPAKFKSTEGIDILWIEEGEKVTENSWLTITPTVRNAGSEIWCSFNPDLASDPTSKRFIVNPMPHARIIETNWRDNPWFPEKLQRDKDYLARVDVDAYQHVWEGKFRKNSAAQIFKGKYIIAEFTPDPKTWNGPYQGADWGFSQDPSVLIRCWVHERKLYIEHEAYGIGVDTRKLPELFDAVPDARRYQTRGDNARPETISDLVQHGYPRMVPCEKWTGSVEDGIAHIRSYEQVVIHPRCVHTADEALLYSFKVDKLDPSLILTDIVDKHNHCWDSVRYALQPLIRTANTGFLQYARQAVEDMKARQAQEHQPS